MEIKRLIEDKNLKLTTARKELLEIFLSEKKPLSFEDIKDRISMDKATFYRNISKFENESIVNSFESNDRKKYYEVQEFPHAHFICNLCNEITCLKSTFNIKIHRYIIQDMILKGVCEKCNI